MSCPTHFVDENEWSRAVVAKHGLRCAFTNVEHYVDELRVIHIRPCIDDVANGLVLSVAKASAYTGSPPRLRSCSACTDAARLAKKMRQTERKYGVDAFFEELRDALIPQPSYAALAFNAHLICTIQAARCKVNKFHDELFAAARTPAVIALYWFVHRGKEAVRAKDKQALMDVRLEMPEDALTRLAGMPNEASKAALLDLQRMDQDVANGAATVLIHAMEGGFGVHVLDDDLAGFSTHPTSENAIPGLNGHIMVLVQRGICVPDRHGRWLLHPVFADNVVALALISRALDYIDPAVDPKITEPLTKAQAAHVEYKLQHYKFDRELTVGAAMRKFC